MSFATASCDLWQNEQRKVSSGDLGFKPNSFITQTFNQSGQNGLS